jgi:hypothetical protein
MSRVMCGWSRRAAARASRAKPPTPPAWRPRGPRAASRRRAARCGDGGREGLGPCLRRRGALRPRRRGGGWGGAGGASWGILALFGDGEAGRRTALAQAQAKRRTALAQARRTNHRERENRPTMALRPVLRHFPAPRGARLRPNGAQVAQACMVIPAGCCLCFLCEPKPASLLRQALPNHHDGAQRLQRPSRRPSAAGRSRLRPPGSRRAWIRSTSRSCWRSSRPGLSGEADRGHRADALLPTCRARRLGSGHSVTQVDRRKGAGPLRAAPRLSRPSPNSSSKARR